MTDVEFRAGRPTFIDYANGFETGAVAAFTGRVTPHAAATWTAYGNSSSQLASCAFVGDPGSGASSTPIGSSTPATPGS